MADYDDGDKKEDGSDMEWVTTTARSVKHQTRPLIDHFERLLEEACPNHAYPIKRKLKDCDMMRNFMTSGTLTRDKECEEDPGRRDVTPFPEEDVVTTVHDGCPLPGGAVCLT
jgi:hypothetical protein